MVNKYIAAVLMKKHIVDPAAFKLTVHSFEAKSAHEAIGIAFEMTMNQWPGWAIGDCVVKRIDK
jgi:hypothetical protein